MCDFLTTHYLPSKPKYLKDVLHLLDCLFHKEEEETKMYFDVYSFGYGHPKGYYDKEVWEGEWSWRIERLKLIDEKINWLLQRWPEAKDLIKCN